MGFIFLAVALSAVLAFGDLVLFAFKPAQPGSDKIVILEVRKGQNNLEITRSLESEGVVRDAKTFYRLGRLSRQWKNIKAGEYKVSPAMSPIQIFSILTSGISLVHQVTLREGENMYEIAADLESKRLTTRKRFLELCRDPEFFRPLLGDQSDGIANLEGYLFPDTYFFNRSLSAEDMIRQMVRRFLAMWSDAELMRAKELGFSRHQTITLASIVEKETGVPQERPMISSVFHNRLKKKMRLQSDPTTIYGIWERYDGNLQKADLSEKTPYNTYAISGLPPGPISNPGKEAIHAALFPVESPFLFFVSHNDGTHEFTRTFAEHSNAVRRFQMDRSARAGKSWRDFSTRAKGATGTPKVEGTAGQGLGTSQP